ncbi:M14 family metallopeptidase [Streptomyces sp. TRM 70351]|uniref:M14 family metallopeptidase n=1 Tax=Streptomyces sp. TRM 70351 TaxID=3116552 RepID=UPI002E7C490E|nr:M14 family metallopeptidase [Streptomyces sp. TRM 70351]MEE1931107.1 M14 family metallopeptidase [Streptomyces sp. TRM 70351]
MRLNRTGRRTTSAAVLLALALAVPLGTQATASPAGSGTAAERQAAAGQQADRQYADRQYEISGVTTAVQRTEVTRLGTAIDEVRERSVVVTADAAEAARLRAHGYRITALPAPSGPDARQQGEDGGVRAAAPSDYHSYAETMAAVDRYVRQYPNLMSKHVIGRSYQGRDIVAVKVSANVRADENEPEVMFTHNIHAREHLTAEMAIYALGELGSQYGRDQRVTRMLDSRELWVLPVLNPDGKVYDMDSGQFRMWRKNRQPASWATGTDLNRNFPYKWGCCGGSSGSPSSDTYRGTGPASATETRVLLDFVRSRVVGGQQQITAHIDWHTYSELILWPFGYTYNDTAPGLNQDARNAFAAVGTQMARSNGYTPQQSSDLYITDGSINDTMWADHGIFSYTFEMYPRSSSGGGFYPPGSVIPRETARNREAMLILLENADCMYRSIGKAGQYCSA